MGIIIVVGVNSADIAPDRLELLQCEERATSAKRALEVEFIALLRLQSFSDQRLKH